MLGGAVRRAFSSKKTPSLQLVRRKPADAGELEWDPMADQAVADSSRLEGARAAIHLSGANVAAHRWTESYQREMIASRVDSTQRLATMLAGLHHPPKTLLVASAIGIYGDRGDEVLDETAQPERVFLRVSVGHGNMPPMRRKRPAFALCIFDLELCWDPERAHSSRCFRRFVWGWVPGSAQAASG